MSSKIFPFKPRKIKPLKPQATDQEITIDYRKDERRERRKIMAQLYEEDLARRAEKLLQGRPPCPCCGLALSKYQEALLRQKGAL